MRWRFDGVISYSVGDWEKFQILKARAWFPASGGRMREAIHRFATAIAFRLKPEATHFGWLPALL